MSLYRQSFPNGKISLELHIPEDPTIEQITNFKSGLGKLNEEGGAATHDDQNKDARQVYIFPHQPLQTSCVSPEGAFGETASRKLNQVPETDEDKEKKA